MRVGEGGKDLLVDLAVENRTQGPLWVCDRLVVPQDGKWALTDRLIVMNGSAAGEARLARASMSSDRPAAVIYPASFTRLEPGQRYQETVQVPWPLQAWHPVGASPLQGTPTRAHLTVGVFSGEPPSWTELQGADGSTLKLPQGYSMEWMDGGVQPLPSP